MATSSASNAGFSPSSYLKGLGWLGTGHGLTPSNPNARAKPVTVAHKKSLTGVGRDRDTSHQWWDDVFKAVASKVGSEASSRSGSSTPVTDHDRTTTGIISPRPPKPRAAAADDVEDRIAEPATISGGGGINRSIMAAAQLASARRELYSRFMKGSTGAGGTISPSLAATASAEEGEKGAGDSTEKKTKKGKGKEKKSAAQIEAKAIRKAIRDKRRVRRAEQKAQIAAVKGATEVDGKVLDDEQARLKRETRDKKGKKRRRDADDDEGDPANGDGEGAEQDDETVSNEHRKTKKKAKRRRAMDDDNDDADGATEQVEMSEKKGMKSKKHSREDDEGADANEDAERSRPRRKKDEKRKRKEAAQAVVANDSE